MTGYLCNVTLMILYLSDVIAGSARFRPSPPSSMSKSTGANIGGIIPGRTSVNRPNFSQSTGM